MRDAVAGVIALLLLVVAASLATTLTYMRRQRQRARQAERDRGRTLIVEIPGGDDLMIFSEDDRRFYYGERSIDKDRILSARLLINGAPIAEAHRSTSGESIVHPHLGATVDDQPEGIARDKWDVAIDGVDDALVVPCGSIRERVSQELARTVFDAVKRAIDAGDHHSASGTPPR